MPSLREYVACYQIDSRRLQPRQLLMHPGPVNRGVELSAEVIESPQALIVDQVASGLVVRMAILYDLLSARGSDGAARRRARADGGAAGLSGLARFPRVQLCARAGERRRRCCSRGAGCSTRAPASTARTTCSSATARSPRSARPGRSIRPTGREVVDGEGLHVFPGFVDPHVHLRTPGREDEEDLESGTRAAAAGGFCCVLAMPNTDPVVDSASVLRALQERAGARGARAGRLPRRDHAGPGRARELTEMVELAREGAAGFSDDGVPVADARRMRQALQYQRLAGGVLALHEEDPALSGARRDARGRGLDAARPGGHPLDLGEHDDRARRRSSRATRAGASTSCTCPPPSRSRRSSARKAEGVEVTAEVTPHHLTLTDEAVRSLDPRFKMNPPLRVASATAQALIDGPALGRDRLHRDRPRAALARGEGGAVRAGADGRHRARDGVRGALHGARAARACSSCRCSSSA